MTRTSFGQEPYDPAKVTWLVSERLNYDDHTGYPTLVQATVEEGCQVVIGDSSQRVFQPDNPPIPAGCVITWGPHPWVQAMMRAFRGVWAPGCYSRLENLEFSVFAAHLGDLLLSDDFIILPLAQAVVRGGERFGPEFFVRPNAGGKAFPGGLVQLGSDTKMMRTLHGLVQSDPTLLCVLASRRDIIGEYRFVIVQGRVVAESQYVWERTLDVRTDVLPAARLVADDVAARRWQADTAYTCDVAVTRDGRPYLLELNSLSSAGLYACDTRAIAAAASRAAWDEFQGDP